MDDLVYYETDGQGEETLTLLHGLGMGSQIFEPIRPLLSEHFRLIMIDRRGLGGSAHLKPSGDMKVHLQDMAAVLDRENVAQTHLLGVSMGGTIAQQFAYEFAHRVNKLALMVTLARLKTWQRWGLHLLPFVGPLGFYELLQHIGLRQLDIGKPGDDLYERAKSVIKKTKPEMLGWEGRVLRSFNSQPFLDKIQNPCLILSATRDKIVPASFAFPLTERIPNSRFELLPAGHGALGTHKELVSQKLVDFLKKTP